LSSRPKLRQIVKKKTVSVVLLFFCLLESLLSRLQETSYISAIDLYGAFWRIDKVIPAALREHIFVYIDDLLVSSPTFKQHLNMLRQVGVCLRRAKLNMNVKKVNSTKSSTWGILWACVALKPTSQKCRRYECFPSPLPLSKYGDFWE